MISGISHITLIVKDLNKTTIFLESIFDAIEIYCSGESTFSLSKEKFFLINEIWICIMEDEDINIDRSYNHIAFKIDEQNFNEYVNRIKNAGLDIKQARSRVQGEGQSIYFYDFDNHLFELHTGTLESRLLRYQKEKT